jgi:hypothetical protein
MAGQPPLPMPQGLPAPPPPMPLPLQPPMPQPNAPQLMAPLEAAAAPQLGGAARRPTTFLELYQDPQRDPCQGQYASILARFNTESAQATAPNILLEQAVCMPAQIPQAYLCCALSRRGLRIYCMHMPSRFVAALDGKITPWDNSLFAFLGDVVHGLATTVSFPVNAFQATANIRVLPYEAIVEGLNQLADNTDLLPPVEAADPQGQLVATRTLMYLPCRYVPYFLDAGGYTIRQAWQILLPLLQANDDMVNCRALIQWLRVASHATAPHNGHPNGGPPVVATNLITPAADADLLEHRALALTTALPGRNQLGASMETALLTLAQSVVAQTNDVRQAREANAAAQNQPTLPSTKYRNTIGILLAYVQVQDEANLPELWHQWANAEKRQEQTILRELLDACARQPNAFSTMSPVVTPKLLQDLRSFTFLADSTDDLKTGLQPFAVTDGSAEHRRANLELARQYGLLHEGEHSVTLSDLQALEAKEVRSVPLTYYDLEQTLGMFGNLLEVVLGGPHPLTTAYRNFWQLLTRSMRNNLQMAIDNTGRIKPAHILRSVQLICHQWFERKRAHMSPPTPPFLDILDSIALYTYVLPHLPTALFRLAFPQPTKTVLPAPSTFSVVTPVPSLTTSDASVVSGLTSGSRLSNSTERTGSGGRGTFVANLQPDSTLIQLIPGNIRLKDLIGVASVPTAEDGTSLCMSYHLRNGCWSNCARRATHRTISASEKQRIADFALAQHPNVQRPGGGGPYQQPPDGMGRKQIQGVSVSSHP